MDHLTMDTWNTCRTEESQYKERVISEAMADISVQQWRRQTILETIRRPILHYRDARVSRMIPWRRGRLTRGGIEDDTTNNLSTQRLKSLTGDTMTEKGKGKKKKGGDGKDRKESDKVATVGITYQDVLECFMGRDDEDIANFLDNYEEICEVQEIPEEKMARNLMPRRKGQAKLVIRTMDKADRSDYGRSRNCLWKASEE